MGQNLEIDINLIEHNLELSPEERLKQHQIALNILFEIDEAREQLREKSKQSS